MATSVIMPALEMAQESGVLVSWLKHDGDAIVKGEPLMEIETDKVTVEIEAPASGFLSGVLAKEGDVVPVGQTIAWILAAGEQPPASIPLLSPSGRASTNAVPRESIEISPLARRMAEEHGIDLTLIKSNGRRIEKADVLAHIDATRQTQPESVPVPSGFSSPTRLTPASPKARRLAQERGIDITLLKGTGPDNAVLAEDVPLEIEAVRPAFTIESPGTVWRVMAEHMTASWTTVPHFYLIRDMDASRLITWRESFTAKIEKAGGIKPTYTDLLVKLIGFTLREHPRLNSSWINGDIQFNRDVNIGIAVATDQGLIVPVIRQADRASVREIAAQRKDLVERAQNRKLHPVDISDGTFTISNLGMYNVDIFNAIVNTPQAAILAVGRIAERVVPLKGQPAVRPMLTVSLSCDHRVVDGARAAQFLDELANLIEEPAGMLS
jgi:pyruvate dehydrogenase E2 component (dihydrolipoamide acetyltransferase)